MTNKINLFNAKIYNETGASDVSCYTCVVCGKLTDLSGSVSHQGWCLVCNECYHFLEHKLGYSDLLTRIHKLGRAIKEIHNEQI